MDIGVWLALLTLVLYLLIAADLLRGNALIARLTAFAPLLPEAAPSVSIVVAARNEERHLRTALQSLLRLDYPDLELVVVDDRSEDATGAILDELAVGEPRLTVVHVAELPEGWLGKNHALWMGSQQARGALLLFTDADIVMQPDTLRRAVAALTQLNVDHLALTPSMSMPTVFLGMFGAAFTLFFGMFARPWKARDPRSPHHIGIGAFNLVRASAYRAVDGHRAIRLRPDDDMKLGKLLKRAGCRQDVVYAPEFLSVEWYASVREVILGLEKNAFSGADYNIPLVVLGALFHLLATVWPYLAIFLTHGPTRLIYAGVVAVMTFLVAISCRCHRFPTWYAVGYPLATLLFVWILLRTMTLNLSRGGIVWRGTFYSLEELRKNKI